MAHLGSYRTGFGGLGGRTPAFTSNPGFSKFGSGISPVKSYGYGSIAPPINKFSTGRDRSVSRDRGSFGGSSGYTSDYGKSGYASDYGRSSGYTSDFGRSGYASDYSKAASGRRPSFGFGETTFTSRATFTPNYCRSFSQNCPKHNERRDSYSRSNSLGNATQTTNYTKEEQKTKGAKCRQEEKSSSGSETEKEAENGNVSEDEGFVVCRSTSPGPFETDNSTPISGVVFIQRPVPTQEKKLNSCTQVESDDIPFRLERQGSTSRPTSNYFDRYYNKYTNPRAFRNKEAAARPTSLSIETEQNQDQSSPIANNSPSTPTRNHLGVDNDSGTAFSRDTSPNERNACDSEKSVNKDFRKSVLNMNLDEKELENYLKKREGEKMKKNKHNCDKGGKEGSHEQMRLPRSPSKTKSDGLAQTSSRSKLNENSVRRSESKGKLDMPRNNSRSKISNSDRRNRNSVERNGFQELSRNSSSDLLEDRRYTNDSSSSDESDDLNKSRSSMSSRPRRKLRGSREDILEDEKGNRGRVSKERILDELPPRPSVKKEDGSESKRDSKIPISRKSTLSRDNSMEEKISKCHSKEKLQRKDSSSSISSSPGETTVFTIPLPIRPPSNREIIRSAQDADTSGQEGSEEESDESTETEEEHKVNSQKESSNEDVDFCAQIFDKSPSRSSVAKLSKDEKENKNQTAQQNASRASLQKPHQANDKDYVGEIFGKSPSTSSISKTRENNERDFVGELLDRSPSRSSVKTSEHKAIATVDQNQEKETSTSSEESEIDEINHAQEESDKTEPKASKESEKENSHSNSSNRKSSADSDLLSDASEPSSRQSLEDGEKDFVSEVFAKSPSFVCRKKPSEKNQTDFVGEIFAKSPSFATKRKPLEESEKDSVAMRKSSEETEKDFVGEIFAKSPSFVTRRKPIQEGEKDFVSEIFAKSPSFATKRKPSEEIEMDSITKRKSSEESEKDFVGEIVAKSPSFVAKSKPNQENEKDFVGEIFAKSSSFATKKKPSEECEKDFVGKTFAKSPSSSSIRKSSEESEKDFVGEIFAKCPSFATKRNQSGEGEKNFAKSPSSSTVRKSSEESEKDFVAEIFSKSPSYCNMRKPLEQTKEEPSGEISSSDSRSSISKTTEDSENESSAKDAAEENDYVKEIFGSASYSAIRRPLMEGRGYLSEIAEKQTSEEEETSSESEESEMSEEVEKITASQVTRRESTASELSEESSSKQQSATESDGREDVQLSVEESVSATSEDKKQPKTSTDDDRNYVAEIFSGVDSSEDETDFVSEIFSGRDSDDAPRRLSVYETQTENETECDEEITDYEETGNEAEEKAESEEEEEEEEEATAVTLSLPKDGSTVQKSPTVIHIRTSENDELRTPTPCKAGAKEITSSEEEEEEEEEEETEAEDNKTGKEAESINQTEKKETSAKTSIESRASSLSSPRRSSKNQEELEAQKETARRISNASEKECSSVSSSRRSSKNLGDSEDSTDSRKGKKFIGNLQDIDSLLKEKGTKEPETFEEFENKYDKEKVLTVTHATSEEDSDNEKTRDAKDEAKRALTLFIGKFQDIDEMLGSPTPVSPSAAQVTSPSVKEPFQFKNKKVDDIKKRGSFGEDSDSSAGALEEVEASAVKVHESKPQKPQLEAYTEEIDSSAVRIREGKPMSSKLHHYTEEIDSGAVRIREPNVMHGHIMKSPKQKNSTF